MEAAKVAVYKEAVEVFEAMVVAFEVMVADFVVTVVAFAARAARKARRLRTWPPNCNLRRVSPCTQGWRNCKSLQCTTQHCYHS